MQMSFPYQNVLPGSGWALLCLRTKWVIASLGSGNIVQERASIWYRKPKFFTYLCVYGELRCMQSFLQIYRSQA